MSKGNAALTTRPESGTPYRLDPVQTLKAASALEKAITRSNQETEGKKPNLLAEDDEDVENGEQVPIWLVVTAKTHLNDSNKLKPNKITVPHSLWTSPETRICLITADPPSSNSKAYKELVQHRLFPEGLKTQIARVVAVSKLKTKYKSFESRRQLVAEYDVFLADERIIGLLPKLLGKTFYKVTAKRPVPVSLTGKENYHGKGRETGEGQLKRKRDKESGGPETIGQPFDVGPEIQKALDSTLVHLAPASTTAIRVAWAGWPAEWVAENIEAVVGGVTTKFVPKGWRGLKSLHIKSPNSIALPIWLASELWADDDAVLNQESPFTEETFNKKRPRVAADKSKADDAVAGTNKRKSEDIEGDAPITKKTKKVKKDKDAAAAKLKESTARKEDLENQKRAAQREAKQIAEAFKVTKKKKDKVSSVSDVSSKKSAVESVSV